MTTLVLLVLAVIWGILLVSWLRSRTEGGLSDSVGTFRRHLHVLERAAPSTVIPANRLGNRPSAGRIPPYRGATPIPGQRIGAPVRRAPLQAAPPARRMPSQASLRKRQSQKRRRDVFVALLAGTIGSLALAIIPGLSIMWSVQVLFDILLVGYVALLIHIRNLAAERELKLTRLPRARSLSRPQPSYDFGGGYGGVERVAN